VIDLLTGGRIELFQCGEPRSHGGWLQGRFRAHLLDGLVRSLTGAPVSEDQGAPMITIDYRDPSPSEAWAARVKELYDQGKLIKAIAAELGITQNLAAKALDSWYEREGLPRPDSRARRSTLDDKHLEPPLFVKLSDEAMRLYEAGHTAEEIAARLKCSRPTATKAIRHWHQSRSLPEPAGRRSCGGSDRGRSRPKPQRSCEAGAAPPAA
jgi:transposase